MMRLWPGLGSLFLLTALAFAPTGCKSSKSIIEKGRADMEKRLAQVAAVAADAKKAPPVGPGTRGFDAGAQLQVCPFSNYTERVQDQEDAKTCNTHIAYLDQLESPSKPVEGYDDRYAFGDDGWLLDSRNFLDRGLMAPSKYGPGDKASPEFTERTCDALIRTRYLLVLKPQQLHAPFEADALLYELEGAKPLGAVHVSAQSSQVGLVYASGSRIGQSAGGRDYSANAARRALWEIIKAQVKGAHLPYADE